MTLNSHKAQLESKTFGSDYHPEPDTKAQKRLNSKALL